MRTQIARQFRFEAAHRLPNLPPDHKCSRLHGHSFFVTIRIEGPLDPHVGWIMDFADIDAAWKDIHAQLDHRYLNDIPGLENPTSELIAQWIANTIKLPREYLHSVTVHENCVSECTVFVHPSSQ